MIKITLSTLALISGVAYSSHFQKKLHTLIQSHNGLQVKAANQTCTGAIERWKKGPVDFKSIIDAGVRYDDPDFPADYSSIVWADYTRGGYMKENEYKW